MTCSNKKYKWVGGDGEDNQYYQLMAQSRKEKVPQVVLISVVIVMTTTATKQYELKSATLHEGCDLVASGSLVYKRPQQCRITSEQRTSLNCPSGQVDPSSLQAHAATGPKENMARAQVLGLKRGVHVALLRIGFIAYVSTLRCRTFQNSQFWLHQ